MRQHHNNDTNNTTNNDTNNNTNNIHQKELDIIFGEKLDCYNFDDDVITAGWEEECIQEYSYSTKYVL